MHVFKRTKLSEQKQKCAAALLIGRLGTLSGYRVSLSGDRRGTTADYLFQENGRRFRANRFAPLVRGFGTKN